MINPCTQSFYQYWGKSDRNKEDISHYHLLIYHALDTAAVIQVLIEKEPIYQDILSDIGFCFGCVAKKFVVFLAALHDIGKFSESFQNLNPDLLLELQGINSNREYHVRHDAIGYFWFERKFIESLLDHEIFPFFKFEDNFNVDDWWDILRPLFSASSGHHGEPKSSDSIIKSIMTDQNLTDGLEFAQKAAELIFSEKHESPVIFQYQYDNYIISGKISWVIAGLITLADWIASQEDFFEFYQQPMDLKKYWYNIAIPSAEKAFGMTGLGPISVSKEGGMSGLFPKIQKPTRLQSLAGSCIFGEGPQFILVEDLCGHGKTEASLVIAHRLMQKGAEGLFFALPTMATANAMYHRVKGFHDRLYQKGEKNPNLVLTHSASRFMQHNFFMQEKNEAELIEYGAGEMAGGSEASIWLSDSRKKALLAHVGIGTVDQALMSVLPLRHQSLRIVGLCRNVLIIDEVHAYDSYMQTLVCRLIEFQVGLGGSVILISATLPLSCRQELVSSFFNGTGYPRSFVSSMEYPLLTVVSGTGVQELGQDVQEINIDMQQTIEVEIVNNHDDIIQIIHQVVENGLCVCWIRNTVSDAIDAYVNLIQMFGDDKVTLFHARFLLKDRLDREEYVIDRFGNESQISTRSGQVLIATQVVEQSLDLDFDLVITDLAPADLLIQRAGRVHRHNKAEPFRREDRGPAKLIINAPSIVNDPDEKWFARYFPKAAYVYQNHGILYLTLLAFIKRGQVVFPNDTRDIIEEVYGNDAFDHIPEGLKRSHIKAMGKAQGDKSVSHMNALVFESGYVFDKPHWGDDSVTPTRLSEMSVPLWLSIRTHDQLSALYGEGLAGWILSQVMVPGHWFSVGMEDEIVKEAISASLPGRGKYGKLIVMEPKGSGWIGYDKDKDGKRVMVEYNVIRGLILCD